MYRLAGLVAIAIVAVIAVGFVTAHAEVILIILALALYGRALRSHRGL